MFGPGVSSITRQVSMNARSVLGATMLFSGISCVAGGAAKAFRHTVRLMRPASTEETRHAEQRPRRAREIYWSDVRFGSKADMFSALAHVGFTPQKQTLAVHSRMSALGQEATFHLSLNFGSLTI